VEGGPPRYFYGPLLPDILDAITAGWAGGGFLGFVIGGFASAFRSVNLTLCVLYGAGLMSTFTVGLVLASRVWS